MFDYDDNQKYHGHKKVSRTENYEGVRRAVKRSRPSVFHSQDNPRSRTANRPSNTHSQESLCIEPDIPSPSCLLSPQQAESFWATLRPTPPRPSVSFAEPATITSTGPTTRPHSPPPPSRPSLCCSSSHADFPFGKAGCSPNVYQESRQHIFVTSLRIAYY